jgi:hypothetical protein
MNKWIVSLKNPHFPIGTELTSNWDDTLFYYKGIVISKEILNYINSHNQMIKKYDNIQ